MTKKQRHLIIGGSGQDGALLANYLVKKGFDVHTTCRNKTSFSLERLIYLQILDKVTVHKCDIRNLSKLKDVLESVLPNYIYFLAGYTKTADSFSEILEIADSNLKPVCFMLDFLRKYMPDTKCLFAGSSEIFDTENVENKIDLKSRFSPKNPYGASKLFLFNVVKQYRDYYNLPVMTALLFNHESELRSHFFVTKKITKNLVTFTKNNEYSFQLGNIDAKRDWSSAFLCFARARICIQPDAITGRTLGKLLDHLSANAEGGANTISPASAFLSATSDTGIKAPRLIPSCSYKSHSFSCAVCTEALSNST